VRDEDTGRKIPCPFCGSFDGCDHLLALIDQTFSECSEGYACERYDEFQALIEAAFIRSLRQGTQKWHSRKKDELAELWQYARTAYSSGDEDAALDQYVLTRLIIGLLEAAGGKRYPNSIKSVGAPGYCSAWVLLHAKDPQAVFEGALADLKFRLRS
jgi:hypothetical protein